MTNDELMYKLLQAKKDGEQILFANQGDEPNLKVEGDHIWDLDGNDYKIRHKREYIIHIVKGKSSVIESIQNTWTRSDFGMDENGGEYILMREVYKEEM